MWRASSSRFCARRRRWLVGGALGAALPALGAQAPAPSPSAADAWRLTPRPPVPAVTLIDVAGERRALASMLAGRVTAVQLMFTGCSSICPLQGALFAHLAQTLGAADVQFVSISIDALGDSPQTVDAWLERFGRHAAWTAGIAAAGDVDRLGAFLRGRAVRPGTHTRQVFVFDRDARLAGRTADDPAERDVAALLRDLQRRG